MALTSRVRLDLALFLGLRFLVVYFVNHFTILALHASLQSQDKTPGEEGYTRWPQGHPPSDLSKDKGENLPLRGFRSSAICFLFGVYLSTFFFTSS